MNVSKMNRWVYDNMTQRTGKRKWLLAIGPFPRSRIGGRSKICRRTNEHSQQETVQYKNQKQLLKTFGSVTGQIYRTNVHFDYGYNISVSKNFIC